MELVVLVDDLVIFSPTRSTVRGMLMAHHTPRIRKQSDHESSQLRNLRALSYERHVTMQFKGKTVNRMMLRYVRANPTTRVWSNA